MNFGQILKLVLIVSYYRVNSILALKLFFCFKVVLKLHHEANSVRGLPLCMSWPMRWRFSLSYMAKLLMWKREKIIIYTLSPFLSPSLSFCLFLFSHCSFLRLSHFSHPLPLGRFVQPCCHYPLQPPPCRRSQNRKSLASPT